MSGGAKASPQRQGGWLRWLILSYPTVMLGLFFLGPFGIMVAVSFFKSDPMTFFTTEFHLTNYARFFSPLFLGHLGFSLGLAMLVAAVSVMLAFPFTYLLTRLSLRSQTCWLVFILSVLSLSEVIIAFSWSLLLSRTAGVSNLFVWLGLLSEPQAWTPGFGALLLGYGYLTLPYTVLMLYPPLSRLDPELTEASQTLGASPLRAFLTVVVPAMRAPILASAILVFVFTLGVYLIPQILGRPEHWTLSVLITDQAIYQSDVPFAAAMAVFLLVASLALIGLTFVLSRKRVGAAEVTEAKA